MLLSHSETANMLIPRKTVAFFTILRASDFFLLSKLPYNCHYKVNNIKPKGDDDANTCHGNGRLYAELSFWERVGWALNYVFAPRGIGYSHQAANVPEAPRSVSRLKFVVELVGYYLLRDVGMSYLHMVHDGQVAGMEGARFRDLPLLQRVAAIWAGSLLTICNISVTNATVCLVFLGIWGDPSDYRPVMGLWSDAYSVRNFWGCVWHQMVRRVLPPFVYPFPSPNL